MKYFHLYCDADGESHWRDVDVAAWLGDDVLAVDRVLCGNEHLVVTDPTPL